MAMYLCVCVCMRRARVCILCTWQWWKPAVIFVRSDKDYNHTTLAAECLDVSLSMNLILHLDLNLCFCLCFFPSECVCVWACVTQAMSWGTSGVCVCVWVYGSVSMDGPVHLSLCLCFAYVYVCVSVCDLVGVRVCWHCMHGNASCTPDKNYDHWQTYSKILGSAFPKKISVSQTTIQRNGVKMVTRSIMQRKSASVMHRWKRETSKEWRKKHYILIDVACITH